MLSNLIVVAEQVGVLFLLMGVGFVMGKLGLVDQRTTGQMSTLLLYVISPCLLVDALQRPFTAELLRAMGMGCALLVLQYAALIVISQMTFRKAPRETSAVLRYAQVYSNNIFMGLPLVQAALGDAAAIFVVPSMVGSAVFQWTHGVALMGSKISPKKVILNPGILGIIAGMVFFVGRITLPTVIGSAISFLGSMNTPLAMIIIGVQMAGADMKSTFSQPALYGVSAIRLIASPIITLLIMLPFRQTSPDLFCALVILSAAPSAGVTSIFAQKFGQDVTSAAQVVSLSTLLSLVTLPIFAALAKSLAF